jgi:glycosyltransferase involved in cell wall biosynthesis
MKPIILCFNDYYLPGYRGGGPIRTIANMVEHLSNDFEFWIVTRDRDLSSTEPYPDISIDEWNIVGQAKVFYASPSTFSFIGVLRLLRSTKYDILYLNSFFSPSTTIKPLLIRYLGLTRPATVVLAPRGEFSVGALALKSTKKSFYLLIIKFFNIYNGLFWQASSNYEVEDICRVLPFLKGGKNIINAPDLLPLASVVSVDLVDEFYCKNIRKLGPLRLIFLSRISPKKNLDYLLRVLGNVIYPVQLCIYGPTEDAEYWIFCQNLIVNLPAHISVFYCGEVKYENVKYAFAENDLFVFPTRGENFGHVIYEALAVGTSVIVSDQTPWVSDSNGSLTVISLDNPEVWSDAINNWAMFNNHDFTNKRKSSILYAHDYISSNLSIQQNRNLFNTALR